MSTVSRPPRRPARPLLALLAIVLTVSTLSACGLLSEDSGADGSESGSFPVTIDHALGEAKIEKKPKRVVTIGWLSQDVVAALGTVPVGVTDFSWGSVDKYLPWFAERVKELDGEMPELIEVNDSDEASAEQILDLDPDLIVAAHSGITDSNYKKLSSIAPTIAYDKKPWQSDWKDVTLTVGTAMGQKKQAQKLLDETEKLIADTAEDNPKFTKTSFAYGWYLEEGSTELPLYVSADPRVQFVQQLGFKLSPQVADKESDPGTFTASFSLEEVDTIKADVYIGWVDNKKDLNRTVDNAVLKKWKPFASDSYYIMEDQAVAWASSAPSVLGIPWAMDDIVAGLDKAVAGKA
ncbi:iron-siderophore ABC transporter substrate-binding protein [Stackebrandtia nassauensis]|uniref:Periplasmic binding protein n=1 Tax=Stackebrandtia nassauensis (strain DSM 44728 / CIP 108903 / NRRL B-16338 / NBRC 102104 / LLR-40K-21) TaxID=446470 RepID=D3Q8C1_STANL|nr:iron-siderophore ABC transporter substrate-binding protein [Stackebrandtia nassauensis]ADD42495.1 periplasmic binding protein [Stackebrandtia nassauensis DSM 44728]